MKKPANPEALRLKMASLCASSEYCSSEIRKKLSAAGLNMQKVTEIIDYLEENKFVDDARFARAFASDKLRFAGWGPLKIRMALSQKLIPAGLIEEALDNLSREDVATALYKAAEAKAASLDLSSQKDAAKLLRFLYSRGFSANLALSALKRLKQE